MNSRERVLRTLEFRRPDRVPRDLWCLPIVRLEHGAAAVKEFMDRWPADLATPYGFTKPAVRQKGDPFAAGTYCDEWGCVFENIQPGVIGEVKHPILDDYAKLPTMRPPLEMLELKVEEINAFCRSSERFVLSGCCARPFERLQFIRGTEDLYMDIAEDSTDFRQLFDLVANFYRREMEAWAQTDVDALFFMDDWGSQRSLLIAPAQWRRLFKPLYAEYCQIAHTAGKKIFMHSDGYIMDIYPDLIEIGLDAVNSQIFCMDIEEIGRRYRGRIAFWGEIDRQHVLTSPNPEDGRRAARRVIDNLYTPEGGVFAQFELGAAAHLP
ncbi:MAG: uroporphyrinogen decarboxylase family protein, partial [Phycisphaerae bacterium]